MAFDPCFPLDQVQPAPYNPRAIDQDARDALADSINRLGMLKPLIVSDNGRLIAGHQRTRELQALGFDTAPAFVLPPISQSDEIRFNQLHNGSDLEVGDAVSTVPAGPAGAWREIDPDAIDCIYRCRNASRKHEILLLLAKYGPWGAAVATEDGTVIVSALYAQCCNILGLPLTVRYVRESDREEITQRFGRQYGRFSYEHLERDTWHQSLTQMYRLRSDGANSRSRTYETQVLPRITRDMRILDFGAGQMDYARRLAGDGYDITAIEFYLRKPKSAQVDIDRAQQLIDRLCTELTDRGRFDLVVCDSVLNSLDRAWCEQDVLTCLAALCKPGGTVIVSGRAREALDRRQGTVRRAEGHHRLRTAFLDQDGIHAMFAHGGWRYQKHHRFEEVQRLCRDYFGSEYRIFTGEKQEAHGPFRTDSWCAVATNADLLSPDAIRTAVLREFDLPLPGGSFGRGPDVLRALEAAGIR